ncbi:MAG: methyltransferase domain-containing protein [Kiritimatiellae bacterium]|nr:methyltransferase domain-containing protein [Kiritimatiellia bacterium]
MNEQSTHTFFDIKRDGQELADILRKIDENLLRVPVSGDEASARAALQRFDPPCDPPDAAPLRQLVGGLRSLHAPYFVLGGRLLSKIAYLMNIPLFFFGKKQEQFNKHIADTLDALIHQTEHMRAIADYQRYQDRRISEMLDQTNQRLDDLAASESQIIELGNQLKQLEHEYRGTTKWLDSVSKETRGNGDWIRLVEAKLMRLSLAVREQQSVGSSSPLENIPPPRIPDENAYQQKIAAMGGSIRINLGCGEKPKPDYLNVDRAELPGVDVVADIRTLPFEPASLDEITSEHLVEHFREQQLRQTIVPQWMKLLRSGGCLRIVCPNWEAMLNHLHAGTMTLAAFKQITFGAQDYDGDDHYAMYTPETLSALLKDCGFASVTVVEAERMNGHCPEMELVAVAP